MREFVPIRFFVQRLNDLLMHIVRSGVTTTETGIKIAWLGGLYDQDTFRGSITSDVK